MIKSVFVAALAAASLAVQAIPAAACGGLVAPNGAIRLSRASTMVDWHDGVEHYLTSFSYQGEGVSDFGWIVPLPAVPTKVEEGGGWTLQRLNRETHPQPLFARGAAVQDASAASAVVLQQVQVRALDITVLSGSGQAVVDWCKANNFILNGETRTHLLVYAKGSPIFMAAKYNIERAQASRQLVGDGAPVLITMKLDHPWVPLEVLANGTAQVEADIYFFTPGRIYASELARLDGESPEGGFIPHAPGLAVQYQQPVSVQLYRDLSSDKNMGWMKPGGWLTYMSLSAPATTVTYDMGISASGVIHVAAYGTTPMRVTDGRHDLGSAPSTTPRLSPTAIGLPPGLGTLLIQLALFAGLGSLLLITWRRGLRQPG
jgi:Uncharacterized protein conserved in bacteria (DUF2330)